MRGIMVIAVLGVALTLVLATPALAASGTAKGNFELNTLGSYHHITFNLVTSKDGVVTGSVSATNSDAPNFSGKAEYAAFYPGGVAVFEGWVMMNFIDRLFYKVTVKDNGQGSQAGDEAAIYTVPGHMTPLWYYPLTPDEWLYPISKGSIQVR